MRRGLPAWRECIKALHPAIKGLAERHHVLSAEVIQACGKECSETREHLLNKMSELLQEQELPQEIAEEWNRRFVSKE